MDTDINNPSPPNPNPEAEPVPELTPAAGHEADIIPFIVSFSGLTSSGKTTISRILKQIFTFTSSSSSSSSSSSDSSPNPTSSPSIQCTSAILHQDDFYKPEEQLPLVTYTHNGQEVEVRDWDCEESIDFEALVGCLREIRGEGGSEPGDHRRDARDRERLGRLPPWLIAASKEDQNTTGPARVSAEFIQSLREEVKRDLFSSLLSSSSLSSSSPSSPSSSSSPSKSKEKDIRLIFLDGFLFHHPRTPLLPYIDLPLLLLTSRETAKKRREARTGYVTLEGFWVDPPGYFDGVVWGRYVESHEHLFVGGDCEAGIVREGLGIGVVPVGKGGVGLEVEEVVRWAVGRVVEGLKGRL